MSVWKNKITGKWTTKFKFQKRQYKREGFKTRSAALAWEVARREEVSQLTIQKETPLTFAEASTLYLDDCKKRFQLNTWRQKAFVFRNFITHLRFDPFINQIPKSDFIDYLRNRADIDGNKAANRDLKELKALYNYLIRNEVTINNPCLNIIKYPEDPFIKFVPSVEDIKKVFLAAAPEDTDLLLILYHTSGRISEILKLKWEDVNFESRTICLFTRKRKGGLQADQLSINNNLFTILTRRWNKRDKTSVYVFSHPETGEHYKYTQKRHLMRNLCKKAGVKFFGFHAVRHHVASILLDSGKASLSEIQRQLRHRRPTTTDTYLHTMDPQLKKVASLLEDPLKTDKNEAKGTLGGTVSGPNNLARLKEPG